MTKEKLTNDILAKIEDRKKLARRDFTTSEALLLISILSSFITATLAVNDNIEKYVISVLGGLSGILVAIYKRYSF